MEDKEEEEEEEEVEVPVCRKRKGGCRERWVLVVAVDEMRSKI